MVIRVATEPPKVVKSKSGRRFVLAKRVRNTVKDETGLCQLTDQDVRCYARVRKENRAAKW